MIKHRQVKLRHLTVVVQFDFNKSTANPPNDIRVKFMSFVTGFNQLTAWPGVPVRLNGELIGGIGVSGARNWREDVEVIAKAFKKFGLDPIDATPAPKA